VGFHLQNRACTFSLVLAPKGLRLHVVSGSLVASPRCGVAEHEGNGQCSRTACT